MRDGAEGLWSMGITGGTTKRYAGGKEDRTEPASGDLLFSSEPTDEQGSMTHAESRSISERVQAFLETKKGGGGLLPNDQKPAVRR